MKTVKVGALFIILVVSILTLSAQEIRIRGNSMDNFYWNNAVLINETDTVCVLKDYFYKQRIPNLKKEVYTLVFTSRFYDQVIVQADIRERDLCKIKMPSYKYYSCSKKRESFFDAMTVHDTLRIFSIFYGCFMGESHPFYAMVTKQDSLFKFEYYSKDSLRTRTLTHDKLLPLMEIEYERPTGTAIWNLTAGEGLYFELNKQVKVRRPVYVLIDLIEKL